MLERRDAERPEPVDGLQGARGPTSEERAVLRAAARCPTVLQPITTAEPAAARRRKPPSLQPASTTQPTTGSLTGKGSEHIAAFSAPAGSGDDHRST